MAIRKKPRKGEYSGFDLAIGFSYKDGWDRAVEPTPAPDHVCTNCNETGRCFKWHLHRKINAFGREITQHMEVIECRRCLNEFILGSLDFPGEAKDNAGKGQRKFNLRNLTKEERAALMKIVEQEIKEGRIK
jgi:hypothetical protein